MADAYVEEGPQPWDWAAGGLVVEEAGGRFEVLRAGPASPNAEQDAPTVLVAGPRQGWAELVELLEQTGFLATG